MYGQKYLYQGHDIIVTNIMNSTQLIFLDLKLGQEMLSADKLNTLPKVAYPLQLLIHMFGQGLVFLEGDRWKSRRKILSKVFNFDFLINLVPLMSELFDECLQEMEEKGKR